MAEFGVVVSHLPQKKYFFIRADSSNYLRDIFGHENHVTEGCDRLKKGCRVSFEVLSKSDGRVAASNIKVQDPRGTKLWQEDHH
jgi:cold shock CspA family protein